MTTTKKKGFFEQIVKEKVKKNWSIIRSIKKNIVVVDCGSVENMGSGCRCKEGT